MGKKSALTFAIMLTLLTARAATYYTVANGEWTDAIWSSSCSTCAGSTLSIASLVAGDVIVIDDQVEILSMTVTISVQVTIYIRTDSSPNTSTTPASLFFDTGGKLRLNNASSQIILQNTTGVVANNPVIDGSGNGASNQILIGGVEYWRASEGPVTGVGTLQSNGTLPITLLSFTAKSLKNSIILTWVTTMEKDFEYFQLERANSGLEFSVLTTIRAKGGVDVTTTYTHSDAFPMQGKNYYRLKSVDLDGSFKYSDVIVSEWTGKQLLSLYPNPITSRKVTLELNDLITSPVKVSIIESRGLIVYQTEIESNLSTIDIPENLAAGRYIVRLQLSSGVRTIPVILN